MNKYLVVGQDGKIYEPLNYLSSNNCSDEFKIVIKKEAFSNKEMVENADKVSNYIQYANKLGFKWEDNAGMGFIEYNYKAKLIMRLLELYARQLVDEIGFPVFEVSGSNFFDLDHPVVEAYANLFGDRLFRFNSGEEKLVMSYDASYPQFNIAKNSMLSYKNIPFAHFSISDCYRYEQSGECMLLFRGRRFNMPDLHPYFKDVDEAWKWYPSIERQIVKAANVVNRNYYNVAKISSEANWNLYKDKIIQIAKSNNREMLVEIRMDGIDRYWIIDIDYSIVDKFSQVREIGCIQIDIGNAKRLDIKYRDKKNKYHYPVIIHSAVPGGLERYLYMILDNFKDSFPLWLHPIQLRLIPVGEKYLDYCLMLQKENEDIRIDIDDNNENVGKRIKRSFEQLIPNILVIGEEEIHNDKAGIMIDKIRRNIGGYPFLKSSWPHLVSKQI